MGKAQRDKGVCKIDGCIDRVFNKGMCQKHYTRNYRYGSPYVVNKPIPKTLPKPRPITFEVDNRGCFNCTSHSKDRDGYASIKVNSKIQKMHRFIYEQCFGEIGVGLVVRHKCDNPTCINPEHLELGTPKENNDDKVKRGRCSSLPGESNPSSKLTEEKVKEIKTLLLQGDLTLTEIGKRFGVSRKAISKIRDGETWRSVE